MTGPRRHFAHQTSHAHELARSRGMLTVEDVDLIGSLVDRLEADDYAIVIDLGAGSGTTALSVMCARQEQRDAIGREELGLRLCSFDVEPEMLNWTEQVMKNAEFDRYWKGFEADALHGARFWEDARQHVAGPEKGKWIGVDLLLHDAGHEGGDVYGDLSAWLPKLAPRGLAWVHDYAPAPALYPGVVDDVDRLVTEGRLERLATAGMSWAGRKT